MKFLMIGAHQDDNEFRVGGLTDKLVKMGHEVRFLSMCNGNGGHHVLTPAETTATRAKESQKVAELLGIQYDVWADQADCALTADESPGAVTIGLEDRLGRGEPHQLPPHDCGVAELIAELLG